MNQLPFDEFVNRLANGKNMNELCFWFCDDPKRQERWLGHGNNKNGYWVGNCDEKFGAEFETVEELVNAPIFDGYSLKQRYSKLRIISIEGCNLQDWLAFF